MTEIEKTKAEIKMLEKKLSFLEELEKTKSPVEEAYKRWMGEYPPTGPSVDGIDDIRWRAFQMGYNASKESEYQPTPQTPEQVVIEKLQEKDWDIKVETDYLTGKARHKWKIVDKDGNDYKPTTQTAEELLKPQPEKRKSDDFDEMMDDLVEKFKLDPPPFLRFELGDTLENRIYKWYDTCNNKHWTIDECVADLLDIVELFLPHSQSSEGSQDIYACIAVDTHNDLLKKIKSKLRNKK